jgi:hypothetical protein
MIMDLTYPLIAGVVFFLVFLAAAYIAYRLLRRSVKMAVRMTIVVLILAIAVVGGLSLMWFGYGASERPRSAPTRKR